MISLQGLKMLLRSGKQQETSSGAVEKWPETRRKLMSCHQKLSNDRWLTPQQRYERRIHENASTVRKLERKYRRAGQHAISPHKRQSRF